MEKVLNQDEIDAMFRAALGRGASDGANEKVHPCDFRQAGQIKKDQVRTISQLHEGFARNLTNALGAYLRVIFDTNLVSVEQLTFREFLARVPDVAYLASFRVEPLGVLAAIELDLSLAFPIIDLLLGGRGRSSSDKREVSEIEEQILQGVVQILCHELQSAWTSINVTFEFSERLSPAQIQRLMPPTDKTLCLSFEIRMPESHGMLNVSLPAVVSNQLLRTFDREGSIAQRRSTPDVAKRLREHALDFVFDFGLMLPELKVSIGKLVEMKTGDILPLPHSASAPATAVIARRPLFTALPIRSQNMRAAQVLNMIPETSDERKVQ